MIPVYAMAMVALLKPSTLSAMVEVGGTRVVGSTDGRAWVSTDAGKSYVATGVGPSRAPVRRLAASGDQAWACTADGVFAMNDKLMWSPILAGVDCKAFFVHEKSAIVVAPNAIHTSTDAGAHWQAVSKKTTEFDDVTDVMLVAGSTKTFLLARSSHTLDRSQDGGKSFKRVYNPTPELDDRRQPVVSHCRTGSNSGHWPSRRGTLRFAGDGKQIVAGPIQWWCELAGYMPFEGGSDVLTSTDGGKTFKAIHVERASNYPSLPPENTGVIGLAPNGQLQLGVFGRLETIHQVRRCG